MKKEEFIARYGEAAYKKMALQSKKWRKKHPEKVAAMKRKWCKKHPEKVAAMKRKWCKKHPEKVAEYYQAKKRVKTAQRQVVEEGFVAHLQTLKGELEAQKEENVFYFRPDEERRAVEAARTKVFRDKHPREEKTHNAEQYIKGGKYYNRFTVWRKKGLQPQKDSIRNRDRRKWCQYKRIIAPLSQIHHQWIPGTADYTGVALVEADQHMRGFVDVIEIIEGEITLLTEKEIANQ